MLNKELFSEYCLEILKKNRFNQLETRLKLLLATCAVESDFGRYNYQIGSGVARSVFQIEKPTYDEIYEIYKDRYPLQGWERIHELSEGMLATTLIYYRQPEALPKCEIEGIWMYYKKYFNSFKGATTKEKFYSKCRKHYIF